ncbi:hypothetical protein [Halobellus rarus]|uniref:Uncharacterized protein n=1 Tax=Halobellus rarus TaxID=1126237 RepID=A0ABD6CJE6_9EURY|nr:hypothetical protein [Halobellus rarus]
MRRRRLLAALSVLPASLAGCGGRTGPTTDRPTETDTTVPGPTATPLSETEPLPNPPESPSPADALAFVREYERVAVRNALVEYAGDAPARRPEVGDPAATLVVESDAGYFLFGACSAAAQYGERGGYGRNRHEVPHFVGRGGHHEVAPWSAVVCESADEPFAAADPGANAVDPTEHYGAEIHLFRFDGAEHPVTVSVDYLDDGAPRAVFSTTVAASADAPDPAYEYVLGNLAVRRGKYRVTVDVAGASAADPDAVSTWTLSTPEAPSWTGLSVFVDDDGRPHIGLPDTDNDSLVPGPSLCARQLRHGE